MGTRGFIVAVLVIFATLLFLANRRGIITDTFMTRLANVATIASLLLAVIVLFLPNNDQTAAPTARVPETTLVPSQPISTASSTVANTPTFTPVPPTPTFTPSPSPKQTSTPTPKPGDVLYQADWSTGMDGWVGPADWKYVKGMLVNDGTNDTIGLTTAPYQPESIADYAVETEIQLVREQGCYDDGFGVLVRSPEQGGYLAGIRTGCGPSANIWTWNDNVSLRHRSDIAGRNFSTGTKWHTYRVEVQGNTIRLLFDGAILLKAIDNRNLDGGKVGLWSVNIPINVRNFKIIKL